MAARAVTRRVTPPRERRPVPARVPLGSSSHVSLRWSTKDGPRSVDGFHVSSESWRVLIEPRDRVAAGRTLAISAVIAAAVTVGYEVIAAVGGLPGTSVVTQVSASVIGAILLGIAIVAWAVPERAPAGLWIGAPLIGILIVVWIGLGERDVSAAGQIGLIYPIVYAGAHLRAPVAWAINILASVIDIALVTMLVATPEAIAEVVVIVPCFAMVTLVLVALARHQEDLAVQLRAAAAIDPLTGLFSRRRLEEVAVEVLASPCLPGDFSLGTGLAIIDVDHFKSLNDTYGHPIGDAALVHVAAVLRGSVGAHVTVARLGGDELALLVPCCTAQDAARAAEGVVEALTMTPMRHQGGEIPISLSIGVAHVTASRAQGLAELYAAADAALYEAKLAGRGRVIIA